MALETGILMPGTSAAPAMPDHVTGYPSSLSSILLNPELLTGGGSPLNMEAIATVLSTTWRRTRASVIIPILNITTVICLAMLVMILLEKLFVGFISLAVSVFKLKPEKRYRWEPIKPDLEVGNSNYPMVLIQIPMYNEKEVYKNSIGAACDQDWPLERMIIQVLDDSTDPIIKDLVLSECESRKAKGINIHYEVRNGRAGYKAGALKEGMKHSYVKDCDYIAMFDADFQPEPDFLNRAMPFLVHNPKIALVQARWKFVNADECMMTRIQEMSLDYHFKIEQEAGSFTFSFFGFNGTAGIWRISAVDDAGGWKDRTTVEDMDLAVRAGIRGWKFVYVGDIKVKSELPSTFKAYRYQQHRWSCGPANLVKKMAMEIMLNRRVSLVKKLYILYSFFFVGKIVSHTITFIFYCLLIPVSVWFSEVHLPLWGVAYAPMVLTLCKVFGTPSSCHLVVFWVLFENVMSLHRFKACFCGLLGIGRVNEWVVTEKLGDAMKNNGSTKPTTVEEIGIVNKKLDIANKNEKPPRRSFHRFHYGELVMGTFITASGVYDVMYTTKGYWIYLILQGLAFFVCGFNWIGTSIPA